MLEGKGKFWRVDNKLYIYVPVQLVTDSAFPFKDDKAYVKIRIEGDRLVISRMEKEK